MNGTEIKGIREKLKLTMEQLADKIGVSFQTIYRWEHDKSKPHKTFIKAILELEEKHDNGKQGKQAKGNGANK